VCVCQVRIYDPYFCNGGVIKRLKKHGFLKVYNRREDFYEKIAGNSTPDFDILLTNPPYSVDHPAKILDFCCRSGKPWLLLVPNWVYIKDYYPWCPTSAAAPQGYSSGPKQFSRATEPVYLVPTQRYTYWTPPWLHASKYGVSTSPFPSFWFIQCGRYRDEILQWFKALELRLKSNVSLAPSVTLLPNEVCVSLCLCVCVSVSVSLPVGFKESTSLTSLFDVTPNGIQRVNVTNEFGSGTHPLMHLGLAHIHSHTHKVNVTSQTT
jgi:hypothetical protein